MSAKLIKSILDEAPELRTLTKRSRQLLHLQQYLKEALPTNIASRSAISSLSDGALTIATDNGAAAAKIRQMAPRLLSRLHRQEPEVTAIKIRVQIMSGDKPLRKKQIFLDPKARSELLTLSSHLDESPLRSAILRLAERVKPTKL